MARVSAYKPDTDVTKNDKILGTDVSGVTKNYRLEDIGSFFKETNQAGIAAQLTYQYKASSSDLASGTMGITFSTGDTFEKITSIKMNKFAYAETVNSSENMMNIYTSSSILIVDIADQDNYGVYDTSALSQDSNNTDFYDLPLTVKPGKFNGSLTNDKIYGIISIGTGADKNYASGTINTNDSRWSGSGPYALAITHNLGKYGSPTIKDSANTIVYGKMSYSGLNTLQLTFNAKFACEVFVN